MNKQPDHIDETLLLKYSLSQTDRTETAMVQNWLEDTANREEYDNWLRIWQTADAIEKIDAIDVDRNWTEFQTKIRVRKVKRTIWLKMAATLLIIATVAFLFEAFGTDDKVEILSLTAQVDQQVLLSDQSEVWLKAGSTLTYPETFDSHQRELKLEGEALFEVSHDADRPFIVAAGNTTTEVLGTQFNLKTASADGPLELVLLEGKVRFSTKTERVVLKPGQSVLLTEDGYLTKAENENVNFLSWRTGNFVFSGAPMEKVMSDLANAYGFTYQFSDSTFASCPLTTKYEQESIEDIFKTLELLFAAKFNFSNNQLQIIGGQCE